MICTLTKEQHIQFFKKIVLDLLDKVKSPDLFGFDIQQYSKDLYKEIVDKSGNVDLGLTYISILPKYAKAAIGLEDELSPLSNMFSQFNDLKTKFDADIQNVIDYVKEEVITEEDVQKFAGHLPTIGTNIPNVTNVTLQNIIQDFFYYSAIPFSFLTSTGQESSTTLVNGVNVPTGELNPVKAKARQVRTQILDILVRSGFETASDIDYFGQNGLRLRVMTESQLPSDSLELGAPAGNGVVYVITDNEGNLLRFDNEGKVTADESGSIIRYPFRMPSPENLKRTNKLIQDLLDKSKLKGTEEENKIELAQYKTALEEIRDAEVKQATDILEYHKNNPNALIQAEIIGGSTGYVNQGRYENNKFTPSYIDTSVFSYEPNQLKNITYGLTGFSEIKLEGVKKLLPIQGNAFNRFDKQDIDNIVDVLTYPVSDNLTNQDKIDYLSSFIAVKLNPNDFGKEKISIVNINGDLILEINGKELNLSKATTDEVKDALLNNALYFNINHGLIKSASYPDIKIVNGKVKKANLNYTSLIKKFTQINVIPNKAGKVVELNGYFQVSFNPIVTEATEAETIKQSEDLNKSNDMSSNPSSPLGLEASKLIESETSPEQEKLADKWWTNSPLSKAKDAKGNLLIPVEVLRNIVNSDAFATWSIAGIKLNSGSNSTHLYHEGWHGFSQLFLTTDEKNDLYGEMAAGIGTFKVVTRTLDKDGKLTPKLVEVEFSKASKKQLEEYAAMQYREYALSKGDEKGLKAVMKRIFKKIREFLNIMFKGAKIQDITNGPTQFKTLNDMFNALYVGDINKYSPSVENVMFTEANAGMMSISDVNTERSNADSKKIKESIDGIISELLYNECAVGSMQTVRALVREKSKIKIYQAVEAKIRARYLELVKTREDKGSTMQVDDLQVLDNNIDLLNWTLVNFGNIEETIKNFNGTPAAGVLNYHLLNSDFKDIIKNTIVDDANIDDVSSGSLRKTRGNYDKNANSLGSFDIADSQVIYLVKSLLQQDKKGKFLKNELGFPLQMDFTNVKNSIERKLNNTPAMSMLYNKILRLSETNKMYSQLAVRLGNPAIANEEQSALWFKFLQTCARTKQEIVTHTVEIKITNPDINDINGVSTTEILLKTGQASANNFKVKTEWQTNFKTLDPDTTPSISVTSENVNYLNLQYIVDTFLQKEYKTERDNRGNIKKREAIFKIKGDINNRFNFLNAIGLYFTQSQESEVKLTDPVTLVDLNFLANAIGQLNYRNMKSGNTVLITNPIEEFSKDNNGLQEYIDAAGNIKNQIVTITSQNSFITDLTTFEADNSDKFSSMSRLNPEGNQQNELADQSTMSKRIFALDTANNINDFSNPNSYFKHMSYLSRLNNPAAKSSILLNSLFQPEDGSKTGNSIKVINLGGTSVKKTIDGKEEQEGKSHSSMNYSDKIITDFNMLLTQGIIGHNTTGNKSSHYATVMSKIVTYVTKKQNNLYIDTNDFLATQDNNYIGFDRAFDIVMPYIQAELEKIIKYNANKDIYDNYIGFSDEKTGDFSLFEDILENDTKELLKDSKITSELSKAIYPYQATEEQKAVYAENKNLTLIEVLNDVKGGKEIISKIKADLKFYFDTLSQENADLIANYGYIDSSIREAIVKDTKGNIADLKTNQDLVTQTNMAAVRSFTFNYWINSVEMTLIHNGDLSIYNHASDEAMKRFPVFQSGGSVFPTDKTSLDLINKKGTPLTKKTKLEKTGQGEDDIFDGTLNTGIIKDYTKKVESTYNQLHDFFAATFKKQGFKGNKLKEAMYGKKVNSDGSITYGDKKNPIGGKMAPYHSMKITDGQGYITLDTYRKLKDASGKWSIPQEALYQRIVNGENISKENLAEIFPVVKYQMAGNLKTDLGLLPVTSAHKFSLLPLIPGAYGWALDQLHEQMMLQDVHYVTYDSGSKLAQITASPNKKGDDIFNLTTGEFNLDKEGNPVQFTKNVIYAEYLKDQVDINSEFKGYSTFSNQLRTLLSTGLIENGLPIDYKPGKPLIERKALWEKLSESKQEKESYFFKLVNTYNKRVIRLVELKKDDLIAQLPGWSKDETTGRFTGPVLSMITFIKDELAKQGLTEHELSYIANDGMGRLLNDLSGSPIANALESKLMSLLNNKILKQTVNGEPLVEVSAAHTQTLKFKGKEVEAAIEKYGNTGLLMFYKPDINGKLVTEACQVKIAMQNSFENLYNLNDNQGNKIAQYDDVEYVDAGEKRIRKVLNEKRSLAKLNSLINDAEWLSKDNNEKKLRLTGVRIPVQGLNSMEYAQIAEFLPREAGTIIILPVEIVAKSGTDFDVDKLTTYMPTISRSGKWLTDDYATRAILNEEIDKVGKQLKALLKDKTGQDIDDIKKLITAFESDKKDIGKTIIALKFKRDSLKENMAMAASDIKSYIINQNAVNPVTGALQRIINTSNTDLIIDFIDSFKKKPALFNNKEIFDVYEELLKDIASLKEIKKTLKSEFNDQTEYNKENPEIYALRQKYNDLIDQKRNFTKAVQNSLINDIINILELPENAERLLTPNDTDKAKPYADQMEPVVQRQNTKLSKRKSGVAVAKGISPTRINEYAFNAKKHEDNFVSVESLGIAALGNKGNIVYNNAGAYLPASIKFEIGEQVFDIPTAIYLKVNKIDVVENNETKTVISLSNLRDARGEHEISEIDSQLMNGFVDAEKNPWVSFIQGNKEVTPIIMFLLEAGAHIQDIAYFVNNPLTRKYVEEVKLNKGLLKQLIRPGQNPEYAKSDAKNFVWHQMLGKTSSFPKMNRIAKILAEQKGDTVFNTQQLLDVAETKNPADLKQLNVVNGFLHYLYIEELTRKSNEPREVTKFDTDKEASLFDSYSTNAKIEELYRSEDMPGQVIRYANEEGPVSAFRLVEFSQDLIGPLFPFRNGDNLNKFIYDRINDYATLKRIKNATGLDAERFPARFKNAVMLHLFVNNLKSFSVGQSQFFKGNEVKYVSKSDKAVDVTMVNDKPVFTVNENLLKKEFKNKKFALGIKGKGSYTEQGLAGVNEALFYRSDQVSNKLIGLKEYIDFVMEREHMRLLNPYDKYILTNKFQTRLEKLTEGKDAPFSPKNNESESAFITRMSKKIYEEYLRNMGLENSYNINSLFFNNQQNGIMSFATTLMSLVSKYPNLKETFTVLKYLESSYYSDKDKQADKYSKNLVNISLKNSNELTPEDAQQYALDLTQLANPDVKKLKDDSAEAREDNERLSDLFRKFSTVIFLQGGMNKNQFAFPSILPFQDNVSAYSSIMDDALTKTGEVTEAMLQTVFNLFLKTNTYARKKLTERLAAPNYLSVYTPAEFLDIERENIIARGSEFGRLTETAEKGVYTIDTDNITPDEVNNLSLLYKGKAYFIVADTAVRAKNTEDGNNELSNMSVLGMPVQNHFLSTANGTALGLRVARDNGINYNITAENIDLLKTMVDEDVAKMEEALGQGVGLVFNDEGYGHNILDSAPEDKPEIEALHKELYEYITNQLLEKTGYINTAYTAIKVKKPKEFTSGDRVIGLEDTKKFNAYLKKSEGELPKEFFTMGPVFKLFYNTQSGKNQPIPQSSKWVLNEDNLYDLIDMDIETRGEVLTYTDKDGIEKTITNIDLASGNFMLPKTSQPIVQPVVNQPLTGKKLKGQMTMDYGKNKRLDVVSNSTFDAILAGERTATTRYSDKDAFDYWKNAQIGDIITWKGADGRTVDVVVTKALAPLIGSGKTVEQWSKLEGWSVNYFNKNVKSKLDKAWQIEFKLAAPTQPSTSVIERTDKIVLRSELKANPTTLYLFGDNDIRKGLGGQAKEMRGEPNAIGVSTKKLPARGEEAYKSDADLQENKKIITDDINKAIAEWNTGKYNKLIIPQMGVGLAELPTRAPETYKFLQQELKRLEDQVTQSSTQPSTIVTETKPTINLNVLLEELRDLEERKIKISLKNETIEDNFIINHWIKVTPESVKEETGVKTGSGKDVSTSLLSKNGLTIDAAAERLGENFGYERGFTDQDIRNIIIDVLLAGSISNYLSIDKNAAGMQEINRRIKEITTQLETVKSTSLAAYTGHSGAAKGADTIWNKKGKEYGITKFIDYKVDTLKQLNETQKIKLETAYQQAVKDLGRKALPYDWLNPDLKDRNGKLLYYSGGLVRRDYIQAALSDGIFAISDIILPGEKGKEKNGIRYANKVKNAIVDGGTGYAVQMGINLNKPVYVFHQGTNADNITPVGWYKWDGANFIAIKTPILTTKFAGIGTQKINEAGKQAIDDVYQETFTNLADHPFKGCEI